MVKQIQESQEQISPELLNKFDNDEELIRQFLDQGYSIGELSTATILHPTELDPVVIIKGGHVAGFWL
jgi:hypothetical protein